MVCLTTFLFSDFRVRKKFVLRTKKLKILSINYLGVTRLAIKSEFSQFWWFSWLVVKVIIFLLLEVELQCVDSAEPD